MVIILNDFCNIFNLLRNYFFWFHFYRFQSLISYITKFFVFFYFTTIFNFCSILFLYSWQLFYYEVILNRLSLVLFSFKVYYFCCCITHNRFRVFPVYILIIIYSVLYLVFVLSLKFFFICQSCVLDFRFFIFFFIIIFA